MAIVYKARCNLLNRFVAVKILRSEFTSDNEFIDRFKVEAQAAASLSHPNIVPIYDVGNQDDIHYIVMEYIDGKTLKEYIIEKGALPWRTAVNIAIQIGSALEHAHKNHIVHRDIKPHNIIMTKELVAKVTDFGIARAASSSTLTMTGNTIGSVHYFSPEQARGGYTDEKSDLYSLGIVLYEMITGKVPFDGETPVTIALKHLEDEIIPPTNISNNVPLSINNIILKAAQKNQVNRYQSASEMLEDLYLALKEPDGGFVKVNNKIIDEQPTQRMPIPNEIINFKPKLDTKNPLVQGEEAMTAKKKGDRVTVIAALATSFVIILIISALIGYFIVSKMSKPIEVEAPNIVGMSIDAAREMLKEKSISLAILDTMYDDKAAKGVILSQKPETGIKIKSPGELQVVVSDGQESIKVPDLAKRELMDVEYELKKDGLLPKIIHEYSSEMPPNFVIRQNLTPNTIVPKNSEIEIFISDGPAPKIRVPDLRGMIEEQARKTIGDNNLNVGDITYNEDRTKPNGVVLSQNPMQNSEVENLTKINITINQYIQAPVNGASISNGESTSNIFINLSNKGQRESFIVKVEVEDIMGKRIEYEKFHTRADKEVEVPVSGKGRAIVRVLIDGEQEPEEVVDFGWVDQ